MRRLLTLSTFLAVAVSIPAGLCPSLASAQANPEAEAGADAAASPKKKKKRSPAKPAAAPKPVPAAKPAEAAKPVVVEQPPEAPKPAAALPASAAGPPPDLMPQLTDSTPPSKLAISAFIVEGDNPPAALVYQLQDGFILGLVRAGVRVIDHEDLKNRLKGKPDLWACDTSPCLKQLGQELAVRYVVRVQVSITGNSYRMSARVFQTTGAAPAALPIETQSRFCDVCTVTEAREAMLRLADGIRVPDEPGLLESERPMLPPPSLRPSKKFAVSAIAVGLTSIIAGTIVLAAAGDRDKGLAALGGACMGAGALTSIGGVFLYGEAAKPMRPAPAPAPSASPP